MKKFHLFDSKCTREVIKGVRQIISGVNEELDCFCLQLSEEGISLIYLLAQTAVSGLCSNLDLIEQGQPLRMLDEKKEIEKKLFVGRLTMNNSMVDQGLGVKLVNDYFQLCYNDNKVLVINQFKEQIHYVSEEFKNINQVKQLESFCIDVQKKKIINKKYKLQKDEQREIDEYIQLIVDPKKILSQKFEKKFEQESQQLIQDSLNNFKDLIDQNLEDLQIFLTKFLKELVGKDIDKMNAALAFQLHVNSPQKTVNIPDEELKKAQKIAMQRYFIQMVTQTWNSNNILKFNDEKIWLQKSTSICLPIFTDFKFELDQKQQNFIQSILKEDDQICNISIFIEEAINTIKNIKSKYNIRIEEDQILQSTNPQDSEQKQYLLNKQELLGECYQKLRQKYLGCKEYCPLCIKQCDVEHNEHEEFKDQRHECQNGHQMQAFGGSKYFKNDSALLQSCDEIRNKDNFKYDGNDINWENFKLTRYPNWNFDSSNEVEVQKNREKNVMIWNLIGKDLCKIYNQNPLNIGIIFKEASNEPFSNIEISKIHYIIMLDDSGSMKGKRWDDLMKAFTIFLNKLLKDNNLKENSWITVINHDGNSIIYFQEKKPNLDLIKSIIFRGGSNDFDKPLFDAHNICKQTQQKYDKLLLYFMSDGEWTFPEKGIKRLLDEKSIIKKVEFHSIAFGSGANKQILQKMADSFPEGQGKMSDAPNAQALAQTFIDIVPNIYN